MLGEAWVRPLRRARARWRSDRLDAERSAPPLRQPAAPAGPQRAVGAAAPFKPEAFVRLRPCWSPAAVDQRTEPPAAALARLEELQGAVDTGLIFRTANACGSRRLCPWSAGRSWKCKRGRAREVWGRRLMLKRLEHSLTGRPTARGDGGSTNSNAPISMRACSYRPGGQWAGRANLFTDYTFGLWSSRPEPLALAIARKRWPSENQSP